MEKSGPKIMRGALMSGCGMWAPILPGASESKNAERSTGVLSDSCLSGSPTLGTDFSNQAAKAKTLKSV